MFFPFNHQDVFRALTAQYAPQPVPFLLKRRADPRGCTFASQGFSGNRKFGDRPLHLPAAGFEWHGRGLGADFSWNLHFGAARNAGGGAAVSGGKAGGAPCHSGSPPEAGGEWGAALPPRPRLQFPFPPCFFSAGIRGLGTGRSPSPGCLWVESFTLSSDTKSVWQRLIESARPAAVTAGEWRSDFAGENGEDVRVEIVRLFPRGVGSEEPAPIPAVGSPWITAGFPSSLRNPCGKAAPTPADIPEDVPQQLPELGPRGGLTSIADRSHFSGRI